MEVWNFTFSEAILTKTGWQKADVSKVYTPVMTNQNMFLRYFIFLKNSVASTLQVPWRYRPQNYHKSFTLSQ